MDIDPKDIVETAQTGRPDAEPRANRLNAAVAITVAVLATFMGICKVKDDNIVQAMQQAQADKLDHWAFYQARNLRQEIAEATAVQLDLARQGASGATAPAYDAALAKYRALAAEQAKKKDELRVQAEQDHRSDAFQPDQRVGTRSLGGFRLSPGGGGHCSKSTTTRSVTGCDWQVRTKPRCSSSGSRA